MTEWVDVLEPLGIERRSPVTGHPRSNQDVAMRTLVVLKERGLEPCLYSGNEEHVPQPSQWYCWTNTVGRVSADTPEDAVKETAAKVLKGAE
ncbi:hypothetical protein LCGC14_0810530 [marine sediment metagenome]|uniref:Uncharacterized protein n=1 Tax=marine sediment metagenome TaxID=412755 RepID=A0A0F9PRG9_9ZZZZ